MGCARSQCWWHVVLLLAALQLVGCGVVTKPSSPSRTLRVQTKGSFFESSNGYVFAVLEDESSRLARVDVRYPVGSADDPVGKEGLAHLVEHLMFIYEIERRGGKTSLFAEAGRVSTYFNARTGRDYIHFESQGLPESLPEMLGLEAQRAAANCRDLSQEAFEREKEVVLNELRQRYGSDGGELRARVAKALYGELHPYGRVASLESVESITLDDACSFVETELQWDKAMVVVSGAVDPTRVRQIAAATFSKVPDRRPGEVAPVESPPTRSKRVDLEGAVAEPVLMLAWPLPPEGSLEYRAVMMARGGLESALSSFAYRYGWGHSVNTWVTGGGEAPHLVLEVSLRSWSKVREAEEFAEKAVAWGERSIARSGTKADSATWQHRLASEEAALISRYERLGSRAMLFCDEFQYRRRKNFLVDALEEMRGTTPMQARAMVRKWITVGKAKVIRVAPSPGANSRKSMGQVYSSVHGEDHRVEVDESLADAPASLPADTGLVLRTHRYETSNGLSVVLWPSGEMPLAHARLVSSSGRAMEPEGQEGLSLISGFDDIYSDSMVYWMSTTSTLVDFLIEDVTLELRSPGSSVSSKDRKHLRSRFEVKGSANRRDFNRRMRRALWGEEHPYGRDPYTLKSVDKLTTDRAKSWARKHIVPKNSTLIVAGKFDIPLVKKWIAFLSDQVSPGRESAPVGEPLPRRYAEWVGGVSHDQPSVVEVDIRFRGGPGIDGDHGARDVLAGIINSKFAALRAEHAITYGFSASYVPQEQAGYWRISGAVDARRAAEAGALVQGVLNDVRKGAASYRPEFVLARRKSLDGLLSSASDSAAVVDRLEYIVRFGLSDSYFDLLARRIAALTLAQVEELAADELSSDGQVMGAYGGKEAVESFLEAAKGASAYVPRTPRLQDPDEEHLLSATDGRLSEQGPRIASDGEGWDWSSVSSSSAELDSGAPPGEEEVPVGTVLGIFPDLDWQGGEDRFHLQLSYDGSRSDNFLEAVDIFRLLLYGEASLRHVGLPAGSVYTQFARSSRTVSGTDEGEDYSSIELGAASRIGAGWLGRLGIALPLDAVQSDERVVAQVSSQHRNADSITNQAGVTALRLSASCFGNINAFHFRLDGGLDATVRGGLEYSGNTGQSPESTLLARFNAGFGFHANAVDVGVDLTSAIALDGSAYLDQPNSLVASPHAGVRFSGLLLRLGFILPADDREVVVSMGVASE